MSYETIKLTEDDKDILDVIYKELENITLQTMYCKATKSKPQGHSVRTGAVHQKGARQNIFGKVMYQNKLQVSSPTKKYPHILPLLKKFIKSHNPTFKFKSVYVNKNVICKKHLDSNNDGNSLLIGLGKYTGGRTVLYFNTSKGEVIQKKFHIKSQSLVFNGGEIEHRSESFKGTRYSLVFFK